MNNELLTVIPFHPGDAVQAEFLCDWIFKLASQKQSGHVLLVSDSEVHAEMQNKVKIASEVAFVSTELIVAEPFDRIGKAERTNHLFRTAARLVAQQFRLPWLWLEPDCVPLKPNWLQSMTEAYFGQPKRYLGPFLKTTDQNASMFMGRTSVYPVGAVVDLEPFCGGLNPFNMVAGNGLVNRATKCRLFQQISYNHETDFDKIREDAVLLHADKTGQLIQHLRAHLGSPEPASNGEIAETPAPVVLPKRRGRPPINRSVTV